MRIFSKIRDFGSDVVSGIGSVISSESKSATRSIFNSAISRISDWIRPDDRQVVSSTSPQVVFLPPSNGDTTGDTTEKTLFGMPQVVLLFIAGGLAAYLVLKRR